MDIVLGVSMTPSAVRMVLVEGENADGVSLDHNAVNITPVAESAMSGAPQQVLDAILGTRDGAAEGGHRLTAVGVAWTDHADAAQLRQSLRRHRLEDVILVSELHAASALAQAIGQTVGCQRTALLFIENETATVAVVRTADGAVVRVTSRSLLGSDVVAELRGMVAGLDTGDEPAQAVYMMGSGVDIAMLRPDVAAATHLPVHAPADGDLALARGAALAAASTPRYEASTVGMMSSEDTAAGITQMAAAGYMAPLGYSAVPDEDDADLLAYETPEIEVPAEAPDRKPFLLVGSAVSAIFVAGVAALAISLAVVIRPTGDQRPEPPGTPVAPSAPAPAPAQAKAPAPPAAPETIQAPVPVVQEAPRTVFVAPPAAAPAPQPAAAPAAPPPPAAAPAAPPPPAAPAPAPAPEPAPAPPPPPPAPAPAPAPAPSAPIVVPVPIVIPPIFQPPVRQFPVPRTPRTTQPSPTYPTPSPTYPSTPPPTYSAPPTYTAPSQPSYPTSTPPVTMYPTYPANPAPASQAPSADSGSSGSGSSGSQSGSGDSGSGDSGSSRSRGPLWPLWPFGTGG